MRREASRSPCPNSHRFQPSLRSPPHAEEEEKSGKKVAALLCSAGGFGDWKMEIDRGIKRHNDSFEFAKPI